LFELFWILTTEQKKAKNTQLFKKLLEATKYLTVHLTHLDTYPYVYVISLNQALLCKWPVA